MKNNYIFTGFFILVGIIAFPIFSSAEIPQEAHIYKTGEVHLIGGRLEKRHAVNFYTLSVWGYQWKVFADYDAKFQSADGAELDPQEIQVDHQLEIKGIPAKKESGLIDAKLVRDLSVPGSGTPLPPVSLSPVASPTLAVSSSPGTVSGSAGAPIVAGATKKLLTISLFLGMKGEEVKILQEFLQKGGWGIPGDGPVTGYFGKITASAVKKFQAAHNLESVGWVGPKTRALINELLQK